MPGSRRDLGAGAAQAAPTAPHATPRSGKGRRSGPERFWARWPVRLALGAALVVSGVAHCAFVPFELPKSFDVNDVDGEAAIPVDLFEQDEPPPPPPPTPTNEVRSVADEERAREAALIRREAGAPWDGGADAARDAAGDARADPSPRDSGFDAEGFDGALAVADAAPLPSASGPRDPQAIVGAAGDIQADVVLVMVVVNAEEIRKNPEGAAMGYLLRGIPQWDQFMSGTDIDPVKDVDWLMISGPSLVNSARDVVLIRYGASDAKVDRAMDVVGAAYAKGGPYDAGVASVRAVRSYADGAERVLLRPRPHVLAVVPTGVAPKVARQLARSSVPAHIRKGEAVYVRVVNPHHPMPQLPQSITELRLRVVPRDDLGADVRVECDTPSPDLAASDAREIRALIESRNTMLVSALTHGIFDGAVVAAEGNLVTVHVPASRDQIATLISLVGGFLGVQPGAARAPPSPAPSGLR